MIGLSAPEGAVLAAVVPVLIVQLVQLTQSRAAGKQTKATVEQFRPNGGSSLRDAIDRLETKVDGLHARHDGLDNRITLIEDHITNPKPVEDSE